MSIPTTRLTDRERYEQLNKLIKIERDRQDRLIEQFNDAKLKINTITQRIETTHGVCTICREIYDNPVILIETSQTYCKECIDMWLRAHNTCPATNKKLQEKRYIPNYAAK